jgi:Ca2+-binding EF-hand superfamily protein
MQGGPAGLRRAWQDIAAGASTVTHASFLSALRVKLGMQFAEELAKEVTATFDPDGVGKITYQSFCEMVMGSRCACQVVAWVAQRLVQRAVQLSALR